MSSFLATTTPSRLGLGLGLRSQRLPLVRRPRPICPFSTNATTPSSTMSASVLVAAAAVAVGAYAFYARSSTVAHAEAAGGPPTFSGFGFRTLTLSSSQAVNHNVKALRFDLATPETANGLSLTSALLAITFPEGRWLPVLRPYTPINDMDETGHVDLLVKKYPGGKQSTHLHQLSPGDTVTFFRIPGYSWTANEQPHIALVAGGQGITPCYQLLRGILRNPADTTRVTLVWGVNTDADLLLAADLADLQKKYPGRLTTRYVVSHPVAGSSFAKGHVTRELLAESGVTPGANGVGKVFISGPPPMEKALTGRDGVLTGLGFTKKQVHNF